MTASTDDLESEICRLEGKVDDLSDEVAELEQQLADSDNKWKALLDYAAGFEKEGYIAAYTLDALRAQLAHWDAARKPTLLRVVA